MVTYANWGIHSDAFVPRKLKEITKQAQPQLQVSGRDFNQELFEYKSSAITMWGYSEKRHFFPNKRIVTEQCRRGYTYFPDVIFATARTLYICLDVHLLHIIDCYCNASGSTDIWTPYNLGMWQLLRLNKKTQILQYTVKNYAVFYDEQFLYKKKKRAKFDFSFCVGSNRDNVC